MQDNAGRRSLSRSVDGISGGVARIISEIPAAGARPHARFPPEISAARPPLGVRSAATIPVTGLTRDRVACDMRQKDRRAVDYCSP
jgi:hypothetical protein